MVKIKIDNVEAIIENFKWKSKNKTVENILNSLSSLSNLNSLSVSNPDLAEAERMIKLFGNKKAKIVEKTDNPSWKREGNKIY